MGITNLARIKLLFILLFLTISWLVGLRHLLTTTPLQSQSAGSADLTVTVSANPNPVNNNKVLTYSIVVHNRGLTAASSVTVTEYLPEPYMGYDSCSATGDVICNRSGNIVQVVYPTLLASAIQTVTVLARASSFALSGTHVANDVEVRSVTFDPNTLDNVATVTTTILNAFDLVVSKVNDPNPVLAGAPFIYTVTVRNLGPNFQIKRPQTFMFFNSNPIVIADALSGTLGVADPYPSTLSVTLPSYLGEVVNVAVTLHNVSHNWSEDIDLLLIGPGGISVTLMSDAGGTDALNDVTLVFDDNAPQLPKLTQITFGTYRPLNYASDPQSLSDTYPNPGTGDVIDSSPYLGRFMGLNSVGKPNANGTWRLYVVDDSPHHAGIIAGGWTLSITVMTTGVPITVTDVSPLGSNLTKFKNIGWQSAGSSGNIYTFTRKDNMPDISTLIFSATAPVVPGVYPSSVFVYVAGDHVPTNNQHFSQLTVLPDHDLAIDQMFVPERVPVGAPFTYTLFVSNGGPSPADNPIITTVLPAGSVILGIEPSQGHCGHENLTVICQPGLISNDPDANRVVVIVHARASDFAQSVEVSASVNQTHDRQHLNNHSERLLEVFVPNATATETPVVTVVPTMPTVVATQVNTPTLAMTPIVTPTAIGTIIVLPSDTPTPTATSGTLTPPSPPSPTVTPTPLITRTSVYLPVITR